MGSLPGMTVGTGPTVDVAEGITGGVGGVMWSIILMLFHIDIDSQYVDTVCEDGASIEGKLMKYIRGEIHLVIYDDTDCMRTRGSSKRHVRRERGRASTIAHSEYPVSRCAVW